MKAISTASVASTYRAWRVSGEDVGWEQKDATVGDVMATTASPKASDRKEERMMGISCELLEMIGRALRAYRYPEDGVCPVVDVSRRGA
jgi:hypothetical protein